MRVEISHFRGYTRWSGEFTEPGLHLLTGDSGVGKTTVLEAIYWALYGKRRQVRPIDDLTNRHTPMVKLEVDSIGDETNEHDRVIITRTQRPSIVRLTTKESTVEGEAAQQWIERRFGSPEVFLASAYLPQQTRHPLLTLGQSERLALLEQLVLEQTQAQHYQVAIAQSLRTHRQRLETTQRDLELSQAQLDRYMVQHQLSTDDYVNKSTREQWKAEASAALTRQQELQRQLEQAHLSNERRQQVLARRAMLEDHLCQLSEQLTVIVQQLESLPDDLENQLAKARVATRYHDQLREYVRLRDAPAPTDQQRAWVEQFPEHQWSDVQALHQLRERLGWSTDEWRGSTLATAERLLATNSTVLSREYHPTLYDQLDELRAIAVVHQHREYYQRWLALGEVDIDSLEQQQQRYQLQQRHGRSVNVTELDWYRDHKHQLPIISKYTRLVNEFDQQWVEVGVGVEFSIDTLTKVREDTIDALAQRVTCPNCQVALGWYEGQLRVVNSTVEAEGEPVDNVDHRRRLAKLEVIERNYHRLLDLESQLPPDPERLLMLHTEFGPYTDTELLTLRELDPPLTDPTPQLTEHQWLTQYQQRHQLPNHDRATVERRLASELTVDVEELVAESHDWHQYYQLQSLPGFTTLNGLSRDLLSEFARLAHRVPNWTNMPLSLPTPPPYELVRDWQRRQTAEAALLRGVSPYTIDELANYETLASQLPELERQQAMQTRLTTQQSTLLEQQQRVIEQQHSLPEPPPPVDTQALSEQLTAVETAVSEWQGKLAMIPHLEYYVQEYNRHRQMKRQVREDYQAMVVHERALGLIRQTEYECLAERLAHLNNLLEQILAELFKDNLKVELTLSKVNKDGTVRHQVGLQINHQGYDYGQLSMLSGGEADRVSFALLLAMNLVVGQPLLLLDEVGSSLDQDRRQVLLAQLRAFAGQRVTLCVSHDDPLGDFDSVVEVQR